MWPNGGLKGPLSTELSLPAHFEEAAEMVSRERRRRRRHLRPGPQTPHRALQRYVDAGFNHVYVHQVGPDQEGFFRFYEREVLPGFR